MTNWKSMFFRLVDLARPENTVNDEAEIIGWATHEDGQHYPIHAAQGGGGGSSGASSGGGSSGGGKSKPKEYKQGDRLSFGDVPQWYLEKNLSYNDRKVFNMLSASGEVDVIGTSEKAVHVDLGGRKLWIPKSIIGREDKTTYRHSAEELSASIKNYRAKGEAYAKQTKGTFKTNPWTSSNGRVKRNYYTIKQKGEKRGKDAGYLDLNTLKYTPGEIDLEK